MKTSRFERSSCKSCCYPVILLKGKQNPIDMSDASFSFNIGAR